MISSVPTVEFEQLFGFLVLGHGRRRLIWFAVTAHPTAEGLAWQITGALPWDEATKSKSTAHRTPAMCSEKIKEPRPDEWTEALCTQTSM
jgi:hypothetical protein